MNDTALIAWLDSAHLPGAMIINLAAAALVTTLVYFAMTLALRVALSRLRKLSARTETHADDLIVEVLGRTSRWLLLLVAVLVGLSMLDLSDRWNNRIGQLWFVAVALQMGLWGARAITVGVRGYFERQDPDAKLQASASATLLTWGLRTALWAVVLLAMLSNLGVNITAFVASLGVGGIAIALAVQNILGDLFASLSIAVDKPFQVGDFVVVGSTSGVVQHIGLKSTRIRSLQGEQVVMSNTELLKQTINNYKSLSERRVVYEFGVTYDATPEQLEAIPGMIAQLIAEQPLLRLDRAHFRSFGDSSLDFEVVFFVLDSGYGVYMDERQKLNLALMRGLAAVNVEFAFPTRTVHIASAPSTEPGPRPGEQESRTRWTAAN